MTIAVGMIGSDGIIIAADQCRVCPAEEEGQIDDRMLGRKITHLERHQVVYAVAGDDLTDEVGYTLAAKLDAGNLDFGDKLEVSLQRIVEAKLSALAAAGKLREYGSAERTLLIAFYGEQVPERQLWRVRVGSGSSAKRVDGISIIGALGTTARFFEHYFRQNLPMSKILPLSSHIVLMGNRLDSMMIEGLDVAVIDRAGFHFFDEEQKAPLIKRSAEIETIVRESVLAEIPFSV